MGKSCQRNFPCICTSYMAVCTPILATPTHSEPPWDVTSFYANIKMCLWAWLEREGSGHLVGQVYHRHVDIMQLHTGLLHFVSQSCKIGDCE